MVTSHNIGRNFQNALLRTWAVAIKQQKHKSLEFSAGKLNNIKKKLIEKKIGALPIDNHLII